MTQNMSRDLFSIEGKVVVITGGCGQLGWQFSRALIERGARVAAFDVDASQRRPQDLDAAGLNSNALLTIAVDVTRRDSIEAGLATVNAKWGTPHALINNAALDSPPNAPAEENGPFESYPESSWDK